jgi:hypothetical protein
MGPKLRTFYFILDHVAVYTIEIQSAPTPYRTPLFGPEKQKEKMKSGFSYVTF